MRLEEFKQELTKGVEQVFLFYSALPVPANFAVHAWLVFADKENIITRWDVWDRTGMCKESFGHVHKNITSPEKGLIIWFWDKKIRWKSRLAGKAEGETAEKMRIFMDENAPEYLYKNKYLYLPGPNSNTFIQWAINHFPETGFRLPPRALGKNFRIKE